VENDGRHPRARGNPDRSDNPDGPELPRVFGGG